jgi:signal transduction histidine kinase
MRLTLSYAALFLFAGAALLAVTYALLANSLPQAPKGSEQRSQLEAKFAADCKPGKSQEGNGRGKPRVPITLPARCETLYNELTQSAVASQRDTTLHDLLMFSLIALGAMSVASGALGWMMAGRVLRPVRAITDAAKRASGRHLGERIALAGPDDELKELADTFDEMLDRLDAAFSSQKRFVADASHELRTPLTVMRTAIDVTLAKPARTPEQLELMAAKVRRSIEHAEALIGALLTLATSDRGIAASESEDLAAAAERALEAAQPSIERLRLRVQRDLEPAVTTGDRVLLARLAGNLVDNAVRHNEDEGWVRVRTGTTPDSAFIEVSNSGPFVAAEQVESLFEPFHRLERTGADGVGLGLAIVKSVATAHGATVEARNQPAGGLVVTVNVPSRS